MKYNPKRIIISRSDSIGDVILTLPVVYILKQNFPDCKIIFLGNNYTEPVIALNDKIDEFISFNNISENIDRASAALKSLDADTIIHVFPVSFIAKAAFKAKIPYRIGTTNRLYHWLYCNKLSFLSRKNSAFHEAQLNIKLLNVFKINTAFSLEEISNFYSVKADNRENTLFKSLIDKTKFNLILHPKSKGSAREWGLNNFSQLVDLLPADKYKIFITGTEKEGELIRNSNLFDISKITDLTGKFSLSEFINFIAAADGLIAASTGPLHIAAMLGKICIGLYPPIRPMHPGRWQPVGKNAHFLVLDKECSDCRKTTECLCLKSITPEQVKNKLLQITN